MLDTSAQLVPASAVFLLPPPCPLRFAPSSPGKDLVVRRLELPLQRLQLLPQRAALLLGIKHLGGRHSQLQDSGRF